MTGGVESDGFLHPTYSLTACNSVGMSVNVSVRLDDGLAERLRLRARAAGGRLFDHPRLRTVSRTTRRRRPSGRRMDGTPASRKGFCTNSASGWSCALANVTSPSADRRF